MSISSKLTFVIVIVAFVALFIYFATVTMIDSRYSLLSLENQTIMLAKMAAEYNVSDLAFNYKKEAEQNLSKLFELPDILEVQIYDLEGFLFAYCARSGEKNSSQAIKLDEVVNTLTKYSNDHLEVFQPMVFRGKPYGTLRLVASTLAFKKMLDTRIRILGVFMIFALILAYFMALTLQRWISTPILHLVDKVQQITGGDLAVRVNVTDAGGEIVELCRNVNLMADSLEHRMREIERAKRLLQLVTDNIPACVYLKDQNLNYVWVNRVFSKTAGIETPRNIVGKTDYDLPWLKTEADSVRKRDQQIMISDVPEIHSVEMLRHLDGTQAWFDINKAPLRDENGQLIGILGVLIEITDRIVLEERLRQSEKMEAIGQLAGGVAHDFNNQLTGILGSAELIISQVTDPEILILAQNIVQIGLRSSELTKQLLAFARKGKIIARPVNVHKLIEETITLLQHSIDRRIQITKHLECEHPVVIGDPTQLQNALLNLSINARDAMPEGGEMIFTTSMLTIRTESQRLELSPGSYLQLSISDTGTGMSKEVQSHIFEPFFTTKESGKGTGLGLAAVYGAIKNHNGTISVFSKIGIGTTFRILIPVCLVASLDNSSEKVTITNRGSECILLVDDEESIREATRKILQSLGYQVVTCADGADALEVFRLAPDKFDLVILDMVMPKMSGRETYNALKLLKPGVKVILISGYSVEGETQKLLDQGALAFLQKPFLQAELSAKIRYALDKQITNA
ncbi:MAG: response regulator [Candidatus Riflebacteria bacterium]|nr:response regulator [Candidatus Riflebacteria bacterium]